MKEKSIRISKIILTVVSLVAVFLISGKEILAASGSLSGPQTVRAGDTINLILNLSAPGSYGVEGTLSYDASVLTYVNISGLPSGWVMEMSGNKIIVYDDRMQNPLGASQNVLTVTFKVNQSVAAGTLINASVTGIIATDGSTESNIGTVSYSVAAAAPLSSDNNLDSLSINGITLSPAFSANVTEYNGGEVEFEVSSVNVNAVAKDAGARVNVSGSNLVVGNNRVTVTVTAANGATKNYVINIVRKQDPNYQASTDATLRELSVSVGILSPIFSPDISEYVVYLPFEMTSIQATGVANDEKSLGVTNGELTSLSEGVNQLSVICKAEDGSEKTYNIKVVVMPKYMGTVPAIDGNVEQTTETETTEVETTTEETSTELPKDTGNDQSEGNVNNGVSVIWVVVIAIITLGAGFGSCYLLIKKNIIK